MTSPHSTIPTNSDDLATGQLVESFTDINHLVEEARDAFDIHSWGRPESEPHPAPREQSTYIEMHEASEHEPDDDVADYIEPRHAPVKVPEDLQKLGVQTTHAVQYPNYREVHVPLSDEKIMQGLKAPFDAGFHWLAELYVYILQKAGIKLEVKHGKVLREFEK